MKHVFIVNPVSGKADASLYLVPRLIDAAAGAGVDYAVELTQHAGHAAEIARQYEVASVPCGSGNDFVRNFGAAEDSFPLRIISQARRCLLTWSRQTAGSLRQSVRLGWILKLHTAFPNIAACRCAAARWHIIFPL